MSAQVVANFFFVHRMWRSFSFRSAKFQMSFLTNRPWIGVTRSIFSYAMFFQRFPNAKAFQNNKKKCPRYFYCFILTSCSRILIVFLMLKHQVIYLLHTDAILR